MLAPAEFPLSPGEGGARGGTTARPPGSLRYLSRSRWGNMNDCLFNGALTIKVQRSRAYRTSPRVRWHGGRGRALARHLRLHRTPDDARQKATDA
jgi:hypothetical protein